jgi:hypothetical protein
MTVWVLCFGSRVIDAFSFLSASEVECPANFSSPTGRICFFFTDAFHPEDDSFLGIYLKSEFFPQDILILQQSQFLHLPTVNFR